MALLHWTADGCTMGNLTRQGDNPKHNKETEGFCRPLGEEVLGC